jgi:hypothetical protein
MTMLKQVLAVAVMISVAPAANAQEAGATAAKDDTKRVCRSYPITGSIARKQRICRTAKDWAKSYQETRDAIGNEINKIPGGIPKV